ncbi:MAG TPA: hypothetical protein VHP11_05425, partial [Tepidisphaeraceae bacterium]|nr:hypothetical protein [Tepidisphaeraceae bacterium]
AMVVSLKRAIEPIHTWEVLGPQATGSLVIASITGMMALGIGLAGCLWSGRGLMLVGLITFLIGGELLAVADIRIYNRAATWPIEAGLSGNALLGWIYNNWPIMVIAYLGRFAWLALLAGQMSWSKSFEEVRALSAMDGAGPWQTARHVIWPLVWPILLAGAVLVLLMSMTEVPATVLLSPQRPQMLVPMLMTWVHNLRYDDMLEASLLLMGLVFMMGSVFLILGWLGVKLGPALRRFSSRSLLLGCVLLLLIGCEKGTQPEAVWCETGTGQAQVVYPRGLCYSKFDDTYYIVDRMARIQHLDRQGQWINEWRMPDWRKGKPIGLSIGPDGNVYVADTHYARVMVYSPKGELLRSWGEEGRGPGKFIYPTDVAFDEAGNVYVTEYGDNDRVQVFDAQGGFLRQFGKFGNGGGELARPESLVVDRDFVYVADSCNHRIAVFKLDGTFVRNMGGVGSGLGEFRFPYGLDQDSQGHLIVAEYGNNRVQLVDKQTGKGIRSWGVAGREPGQLAYPWAVAVDQKDRVAVVDSGNNRVQVFSF